MRAGIGVWFFGGFGWLVLFGFSFGRGGFEGFVLVVLLFWGFLGWFVLFCFVLIFLQRRKS